MLTYSDAIDALVDYLGGNADDAAQREIRRAIKAAAAELAGVRQWRYLHRVALINVNAQYNTGTVVGDWTGGAYERMFTLTTGTWPSWAANGVLRISRTEGSVDYPVDRRISSSIITVVAEPGPEEDISSTSYTLYQDTYTLPSDFLALGQIYPGKSTAHVWSQQDQHGARRLGGSTGYANSYTVVRDPKKPGRSALKLDGWPSSAHSVEFLMRRTMRALTYTGYANRDRVGTVTISGQSVTGNGTAFESGMVGSVFRASANQSYPTSDVGGNPYTSESIIQSVESATALTLRDSVTTASSAVKYTISDPIDVASYMETLFYRCCEKQGEIVRQRDTSSLSNTISLYQDELYRAASIDAKQSFEARPLGGYIVTKSEIERNIACGSDSLFS